MKNKLSGLWAASPSSQRREPSNSEITGGFPCGAADQKLFNEEFYRLTGIEAELINFLVYMGFTPDEADLKQILKALIKLTRQNAVQTAFTTAGTFNFTVPADVFFIDVEVWGGGGGGGSPLSANRGAGGAAGAGYARKLCSVTPGQVIPVTVGGGGGGGRAAVRAVTAARAHSARSAVQRGAAARLATVIRRRPVGKAPAAISI
jgi:hypothetical protein